MASTLFGFQIASSEDPLANVRSVRAWSAQLPRKDPIGGIESIVHLLETTSALRPAVTYNRLLAVMELDRISVPLQAQLRAQYRIAAMSDDVRQRLWRACDDLARWFAHVYEELYKGIRAPGENAKARAEMHGIFARMFFYVGVQMRQGLFRYEQWIPGKWRLLHSVYREACEQGVAAAPFALDPSKRPEEHPSPEQEYLQILLLQRINTGNLTARQIDWAAEWLRGWAPLLRLAMIPVEGDGYWLDLGRGEGLVARRPQHPAGELLYLDMAPLRGQLEALLSGLAAQVAASPGQGEIEEQLVLARRLDRLWLPRAPEQPRRGERLAALQAVQAATGWTEIAAALSAKVARKANVPQGFHYDDYGRLRSGIDARRGSPEPRRADANAWQIFDSSDSGFRIRSTSRQAARQSPGALIALQLEDHPRWQLGIVRRLKKLNAEQTELGVEIISRNAELIMPKEIDASLSGYSVDGIDIGLKGKSFQALYLPPQQDARVTSLPSLVLPAAEFTLRRLLLLVIEGHQYQIRLAAPFERTKDWVWTPLDSVH